MSKTVTSAVLSVVTSYDPGASSDSHKPYAVVTLNDLRLYSYSQLGALTIADTYSKFDLTQRSAPNAQPVAWPRQAAYDKATYSIPLLPLVTQAEYGGGPYTYTEDTTRTAAYDDSSLEALLQTLTVSFVVWTPQSVSRPSTDGLATAKMRVYAAYVDVTFSDSSTQRYWATGATDLPGGKWAGGNNDFAPAPGTPTTILDLVNAVDHESDTTYAEIQATNKQVGIAFSALTNPAKLVLDWQVHASCNDTPDGAIGEEYSHEFTASGGTEPYSWAVTSGSLPPGLDLSTDGTVSGTPTTAGDYEFTLVVTDAGTADILKDTAQAGDAGMTMPSLAVTTSVKAAASSAAYMGVNALDEPYWGCAVAVAAPDPAAAGVDSYVVTVEACKPDGTALDGVGERDFGSFSTAGINAQTLLGGYQSAGSLYTAVKFRLYAVASGVRTLSSTAWGGSANQIVNFGDRPADGGSSSMTALDPAGTTAAATTSGAVDMGTNSLGDEYYSIAVVVRPGNAAVAGYQVTATNTDVSGTAGGDDTAEKDFFFVPVPSSQALIAENLLGNYQSNPASAYHYVKFQLYSVGTDGTRTLVTNAWDGTSRKIVNYGTAGGTTPADLPSFLAGSITCTITITAGSVTAECGTPGIVPLGEAFSFRPTVMAGDVELDESYDEDGTLTWVVTGLPPGLVFDTTIGAATYGHIAGIATTAGTYNYTATITTSSGQVVTLTCPLSVQAAGYDASCGTPPVAVQGLPYSFQPPFAVGETYSDWTFTGLPPGLAWNTTTGHISGTPTQIGTYPYHAAKSGSAFDCSVTVAVQGDSGQDKCGSGENAIVGEFYSYTPPFTSEAPIASWVFTGLAPGLYWDTDPTSATYGSIAGIPTSEGGWGYHATATLTSGTVVTHLGYTCSTVVQLPGGGEDETSCVMLDLHVWQPLFEFTSLQQVLSLPPAYVRALRYQLATELAGVYGKNPEIVAGLAAQAIADVDAINQSNAAAVEDIPAAPQESK